MKRIVFLGSLLLLLFSSSAQVPYIFGVSFVPDNPSNPTTGKYVLVSVSPISGQISLIDTIPFAKHIVSATGAFDPVNEEFYLKTIDENNGVHLLRLNHKTGELNGSISSPDLPFELEFDMSSGNLYGIDIDHDHPVLTEVDLTTGQQTIIDTLQVNLRRQNGSTTLDASTGIYYCQAYDSLGGKLVAVDISTGAIVNIAPLPHDIDDLHFDQTQNLIYGTHHHQATRDLWLVEVQPYSGQTTVIFTIPGFFANNGWIPSGGTVFHQESQTYILAASNQPGYEMISIDVVNKTMLLKPGLSADVLLMELQVDNSNYAATKFGKSISIEGDFASRFTVGPNPSKENLLIEITEGQPQNLTVRIYSLAGRIILQKDWAEA